MTGTGVGAAEIMKPKDASCPCSDVAVESIYSALSSQERSRKLMDWLSGNSSSLSTCCTTNENVRDCNIRRVSASFHILNAIRSACRPHLEATTSKSPGKPEAAPSAKSPPQSYEERFPSLSANNNNNNKPPTGKAPPPLNKGNDLNGKKQKKRIRPVAAVTPVSGTTGVWGNIAKQKPIELHPTTTTTTNNQPQSLNYVNQQSHAFSQSSLATNTAQSKPNTVGGVWGEKVTPLSEQVAAKAVVVSNRSPSRPTKNPPLSPRNDNFPSSSEGGTRSNSHHPGQSQPKPTNETEKWGNPSATPQKTLNAAANYMTANSLRAPDTKANNNVNSSTPQNQDTTIQFTTEPTSKEVIVTPTKIVNVATPTTSVPKVTPASQDQIDRFVELYCTLIWNNLVPSTALEVHLLLRLLNLVHHDKDLPPPKPSSTLNEVAQDAAILAPIFPDATFCQSFAAKALSHLSILLKQFGIAFLQDLVKIPAFRCHLPELTSELEQDIKNQTAAGGLLLAPEQSSIISGTSQTALLTLPFQHDRDSRHNYKSREEQQLYKNREESRDAFLYQLRSFLNVRGKMLDTVQAQRAIQKIRTSSRMVVDAVMSVNLAWFAQFFCDLLLQVGLVPFEETDKELLNIAGKEKLQKLHKRFSSRVGGNNNKSSWNLTSENGKRQTNSSLSTFEQAQQHFPGHQEFFFLFVLSADSYKFNFHLRSQIIYRIKSELSTTDNQLSMHLEKSLLNMQMLAKFLGVVIFSPNWQEFDKCNGYDATPDMTPPDGLHQLESDTDASLSLINLVGEAKRNGHLTTVIPWITDILKMASWDTSIHRRSKVYRKLLRLLREIQEQLCSEIHSPKRRNRKPCCVQLVYFSLESFFGETIGLARAASLKQDNDTLLMHEKTLSTSSGIEGDTPSLDDTPILFSSAVLFSANSHIEELFSLSNTLARIDRHAKPARSPGVSRKLRPVVISRDISTANSNETTVPELVVKGSPLASPGPAAAADYGVPTRMSGQGGSSLQAKLVDSFFHQHREIKDICEFAVHQILKRMVVSIPKMFVKPALKQDPHLVCGQTVEDTVNEALKYLRSSLEEGVHQSLCFFEPPDTHPKIHELAVSLAVARGYESGAPHVTNLVTNDLKPLQRSLFGEQPALNEETEFSAAPVRTESEELIAKMTTAIHDLVTCLKREAAYTQILECIRSLEPLLDEWLDSKQPKIPPESYLRDYFESVAKLDHCSLAVLELCTTPAFDSIISEQRWLLLISFLRIGSKLSRHPRRGISRAIKYLKQNPDCLTHLIHMGLSRGDSNTLVELLIDMVETNFLSINLLEEVLIRNAKSDEAISALSQQCLTQLQQRQSIAFEMPKLKNFLNN